MKKTILFILVVFSLVLFGYAKRTWDTQQKRKQQITELEDIAGKLPKMCEEWLAGGEPTWLASCKTFYGYGRTIYVQFYSPQDSPSHYFDAQGVFLGACDPWKLGEDQICSDKSIRCEFDKNVFEEFCKK